MISLKKTVQNYKQSRPKILDLKKYYSDLKFSQAVKNAPMAIGPNGKMNSHQRRNGKVVCKKGAFELSKHEIEIKKAKSFEDIFAITEVVRKKIEGLGALWSYDTALHIGFNKDVYPKEVYVQAGVKKGVRKVLNGFLPIGRSLPMSIFPKEIKLLNPYLAENFLCIYGKDYKKQQRKRKLNNMSC